jgi:hypothetical protein
MNFEDLKKLKKDLTKANSHKNLYFPGEDVELQEQRSYLPEPSKTTAQRMFTVIPPKPRDLILMIETNKEPTLFRYHNEWIKVIASYEGCTFYAWQSVKDNCIYF